MNKFSILTNDNHYLNDMIGKKFELIDSIEDPWTGNIISKYSIVRVSNILDNMNCICEISNISDYGLLEEWERWYDYKDTYYYNSFTNYYVEEYLDDGWCFEIPFNILSSIQNHRTNYNNISLLTETEQSFRNLNIGRTKYGRGFNRNIKRYNISLLT